MSRNRRIHRGLILMVFASFLGLGLAAPAEAGFSVVYAPTYTLLSGNTGGLSPLGGGMIAEFTSLEFGAFYQQKSLNGANPAYLDGVLKYNFGLGPIIQAGLGGYYDILLAANGANVTNSDYGLVAGVQTGIKIFVGLNFKYALANSNAGPIGTTNFHLLQALVGLRL